MKTSCRHKAEQEWYSFNGAIYCLCEKCYDKLREEEESK